MFRPYVGITDFMVSHQVEVMRDVFVEAGGVLTGHCLGVGVMTSYKRVHGFPTSWETAFPQNGEVADIFVRDPRVFNVLHYADYRGLDIAASLELATQFGGPNMQALQLDMVWPSPSIIREYRARHPNVQVILQVGEIAMTKAGDDPRTVVEMLVEYAEGVDAVLLDRSMGRGVAMDAIVLLKYMHAIRNRLPDCVLVVAGGLGPRTFRLAQHIVHEFPDVSVDSQGQLRPSGSARDPIDWNMAAAYLRGMIGMLQE